MKLCSVDGCNQKHECKGYCNRHYIQMRLHGTITGNPSRTRFDKNDIQVTDSCAEIILRDTYGHEVDRAMVDIDDLELVSQYKWCRSKLGYVIARTPSGMIRIHRLVMGLTDPKSQVDHINHCLVDNRKSNLRVVTNQQNSFNRQLEGGTSRFKGVYFESSRNKWQAYITINSKRKNLGRYATEKMAALMYNFAAEKYFGETAYFNPVFA